MADRALTTNNYVSTHVWKDNFSEPWILSKAGLDFCVRCTPPQSPRNSKREAYHHEYNKINPPFTAVLAAPSLEKRPTEVPTLKPFRLFPFFARARERSFSKMHSSESRVVTGPSNTLFTGASVCKFQPGEIYELGQLRS